AGPRGRASALRGWVVTVSYSTYGEVDHIEKFGLRLPCSGHQRGDSSVTFTLLPSRRATAGVAALGLAAAGAVGVGLFSPAAADQTLEKDFPFTCKVVAGGLDLGEQPIGVKASTVVPDSVAPGDTIPSTAVNITLTMPELLRQST